MRKMYVDIKATVLITCEEEDWKQAIEKFEEEATEALAGTGVEVLDGVTTEIMDSK